MLDDYKCQYVSRIHKVQDYIEHNYWRNMSTKELSDVADFSKYHFNRIFKSVLQESLSLKKWKNFKWYILDTLVTTLH